MSQPYKKVYSTLRRNHFLRSIYHKFGKKQNGKFPGTKLKPFSVSDLKPVPPDWKIGGPDFLGIGILKAGTSWWYSLLLDHPQIVNNRLDQKELKYFIHFGYKGLKEIDIKTYQQAFAAPPGKICGEWSPIYLSHPLCIKYIAEAAPKAKILVILRNPVDRVISFLNEAAYGTSSYRFTSEQQYVFKCFNTYPRAMISGLYSIGLKRLLRFFGREQILIQQYEMCRKDPLKEITRTYRFLGVDEKFKPQNINSKINKKDYIVPELIPEERLRLVEYFAEEVHNIIEMFPEIELSLWEDFMQ